MSTTKLLQTKETINSNFAVARGLYELALCSPWRQNTCTERFSVCTKFRTCI